MWFGLAAGMAWPGEISGPYVKEPIWESGTQAEIIACSLAEPTLARRANGLAAGGADDYLLGSTNAFLILGTAVCVVRKHKGNNGFRNQITFVDHYSYSLRARAQGIANARIGVDQQRCD